VYGHVEGTKHPFGTTILVGPAWVWLNDLPENSIFCWFDLKIAFDSYFNGTYKRAHTASDLHMCIQKKSETSRDIFLGG
jgi:hypothetical protein